MARHFICRLLAASICLGSTYAANADDLNAALSAGDYEQADQIYRTQLRATNPKSAAYANLLHAHAVVLKHLFNFAEAQKEEAEAKSIEAGLAKPTPPAPEAPPSRAQLVIPPPPAAAVRAAKYWAAKKNAKSVRTFCHKRATAN
jgi:hypothetical protein